MPLNQNAARLNQRDVRELDQASNSLAAAADIIQRYHPAWMAIVIDHLIMANTIIVRIQQKGAAAFARYLEKHPAKGAVGEAGAQGAEEPTDPGQKIVPEEAERA